MKKQVKKIFMELNQAVESENRQRLKDGTLPIPKSEILNFGQMSLMLNESVATFLNLIQTGDMDAKLQMDYFTKNKLEELLVVTGILIFS